jgi:hypothetical protein
VIWGILEGFGGVLSIDVSCYATILRVWGSASLGPLRAEGLKIRDTMAYVMIG